jgi:hypothetical protein
VRACVTGNILEKRGGRCVKITKRLMVGGFRKQVDMMCRKVTRTYFVQPGRVGLGGDFGSVDHDG